MFLKKSLTGLTAVACDAAEAARTLEFTPADGMDQARSIGFGYSFTPAAAGTTVITVVLYKSGDGGTTWIRVPAWSFADAGKYTGANYSQEVTLTAAGTFWVDCEMENANAVKAVFSTDTADAADEMDCSVCYGYEKRG